ncbi:hypothetical protein ACFO5R_19870 [Halosolutus amylolyticus]|uniref:Uncharacterized protein n=1 Tax=Halosolutus amylolyticus TaxID=2932267 RepID=A0ABD5PUI3_9EURY|nr:hypothetical protein [Halosolutus amylolyticus]
MDSGRSTGPARSPDRSTILVEAELARAIERLEITKVETLLELADRMELPNEVVEQLETAKTEMETGLDRAQELTAI